MRACCWRACRQRGRLLAFDKDPEAIASNSTRVEDPRFSIVHASFATMLEALRRARHRRTSHGMLLDLGVSSPQIDNPARGFSFRFDGPLDMRMDPTRGESAADFLARADEQQIAEVIRRLWGRTVCSTDCKGACCSPRKRESCSNHCASFPQVVARAVKTREAGQDPATRTFQALRIFVNAELEELEQGLNAALAIARARRAPGGDQLPFARRPHRQDLHRAPQPQRGRPPRALRAGRPSRCSRRSRASSRATAEVAANPRARSAILRVAERTQAAWQEARRMTPR